jgi:hypothetical protein
VTKDNEWYASLSGFFFQHRSAKDSASFLTVAYPGEMANRPDDIVPDKAPVGTAWSGGGLRSDFEGLKVFNDASFARKMGVQIFLR